MLMRGRDHAGGTTSRGRETEGWPCSPYRWSTASREVIRSRSIPTPVPDMDDHQLAAHNAVIDQIWKPHDRKNPNAENIGPAAQAGMPREQLAGGLDPPNDCPCGPTIMLRYVLVNSS